MSDDTVLPLYACIDNYLPSCGVRAHTHTHTHTYTHAHTGSTYYKKCTVTEIPLYLIVSGSFILLDVGYHILLFIFQRFCENDKTVCLLARKCDCCAFFLFVWLILGSAWVLGAGLSGDSTGDHGDCPFGVYVFAAVVIIGQYVYGLLFVISCCISVFKNSCS